MEKKDLKKLTKRQLIKLLMNQRKNEEVKSVKKTTQPLRTGKWERVKPRSVLRKSVNEDLILSPPEQFRDGYKSSPKPSIDRPLQKQNARRPPKPSREPPLPPTPKHEFNFDDDIFQTKNQSLEKFKIISVQSRENKKFKSYTNEFKIKILKKVDDVKEIYHIFQELVKTGKWRRKLSDNDMLRLVIQNEELPNAISTKFNKVHDFKLGDLETDINILEYRAILIEKCKIVVQSVNIPAGKGRLYLTNDTVSRKRSIVMVKNDDTNCLARSIVTAMANLHPEKWTKTQLQDGFNKSRKLQEKQALTFDAEAQVEINGYGNDLSDVEVFAKHLGIEINIIDAEQFNSIVYTANRVRRQDLPT